MILFDGKIINVKMKNGDVFYGSVISNRPDFEDHHTKGNMPIPEDWQTNDEAVKKYLYNDEKDPYKFYWIEIFTGDEDRESITIRTDETDEINIIPDNDTKALMFKIEHDL